MTEKTEDLLHGLTGNQRDTMLAVQNALTADRVRLEDLVNELEFGDTRSSLNKAITDLLNAQDHLRDIYG